MKLSHPDSKQTIEVRPDAVDRYLEQGWVEVVAKKADDK